MTLLFVVRIQPLKNVIDLLTGRIFNLKKSDTKWAWQKRIQGRYQLMIKDSDDEAALNVLSSDSRHFNISNHGVLFHTQEGLESDIYQTVSDYQP